MDARLFHYSSKPFHLDRECKYVREEYVFKPRGLWLSAEGDHPDSYGWAQWSRDNDFRVEDLEYRTEFILRPEHNILIINTVQQLRLFNSAFHIRRYHDDIQWERVKMKYQGIIIYPYQWELRHELLWYYGWDCSSGCIWKPDSLEQVGESVVVEVPSGG